MATILSPPTSISTSALTAPGCTLAIVPASWLRADSRAVPASAMTTTDDALTSANVDADRQAEPRRAGVRDDGDDALAAGDSDLDLVVDGAGDDRADAADELVAGAGLHRVVLEKLRRRRDRPAAVDVDDVVGEGVDVGRVVGDEQDRQRETRLQLGELGAQAIAQGLVEGGERLVEQERARRGREGARERDALPLAARELVGKALAATARSSSASSQRSTAAPPPSARGLRQPAARPKAMFWRTVRCGNSA